MNKSIYEEALEAYGHVNAIVQNKKSHLTWEEEVHHLANITRALQHAKKQEKLLELYKEYFEYSEMLKDGRKFGGRMLVEHERDKLSEEIKELENEQ